MIHLMNFLFTTVISTFRWEDAIVVESVRLLRLRHFSRTQWWRRGNIMAALSAVQTELEGHRGVFIWNRHPPRKCLAVFFLTKLDYNTFSLLNALKSPELAAWMIDWTLKLVCDSPRGWLDILEWQHELCTDKGIKKKVVTHFNPWFHSIHGHAVFRVLNCKAIEILNYIVIMSVIYDAWRHCTKQTGVSTLISSGCCCLLLVEILWLHNCWVHYVGVRKRLNVTNMCCDTRSFYVESVRNLWHGTLFITLNTIVFNDKNSVACCCHLVFKKEHCALKVGSSYWSKQRTLWKAATWLVGLSERQFAVYLADGGAGQWALLLANSPFISKWEVLKSVVLLTSELNCNFILLNFNMKL